jgi:hypothetical protein
MNFTNLVVVDDDVDVHNTSKVLFRLCANTDPQRDSIFTKGLSDVLDHATSEMAMGSVESIFSPSHDARLRSATARDKRGVDLISDVLPFGRLWYGESDAVSRAINHAKFLAVHITL